MTNITGEKLSESQVLTVVPQVLAEHGIGVKFFVMLADVEKMQYRLLLECDGFPDAADFAGAMDAGLGRNNIEYREKRSSGRLLPLQCHFMRPGFFETYKRQALDQGQREGQFKVLALQYRSDFAMAWDSWIEGSC
jgi:hypothetical protein